LENKQQKRKKKESKKPKTVSINHAQPPCGDGVANSSPLHSTPEYSNKNKEIVTVNNNCGIITA